MDAVHLQTDFGPVIGILGLIELVTVLRVVYLLCLIYNETPSLVM